MRCDQPQKSGFPEPIGQKHKNAQNQNRPDTEDDNEKLAEE